MGVRFSLFFILNGFKPMALNFSRKDSESCQRLRKTSPSSKHWNWFPRYTADFQEQLRQVSCQQWHGNSRPCLGIGNELHDSVSLSPFCLSVISYVSQIIFCNESFSCFFISSFSSFAVLYRILKLLIIQNPHPSLRLNVVSSELEHVNFCLHSTIAPLVCRH